MATAFKSDQLTSVDANPTVKIKPSEFGGRKRVAHFTKTLPSSGLATGDTIALCRIPKGARILGLEFCWDAGQGVTATTAIGVSGTAGKYFAAAVTNDANMKFGANTQALNYGEELSAEAEILATNAAAAWTASSVLKGAVEYVVD